MSELVCDVCQTRLSGADSFTCSAGHPPRTVYDLHVWGRLWPNVRSANAHNICRRSEADERLRELEDETGDTWLWLPFDGSEALARERGEDG